MIRMASISSFALAIVLGPAWAEVPQATIDALGTPDSVETSIGTLEFKDGIPTAESASKVYDTLDFTRALNVYNNSFRGASALGLVKGFRSAGAEDNTHVLIFEDLLDSAGLFITGNADTVYYLATLDLTGKILRDATKTGPDESQFYVAEVE